MRHLLCCIVGYTVMLLSVLGHAFYFPLCHRLLFLIEISFQHDFSVDTPYLGNCVIDLPY